MIVDNTIILGDCLEVMKQIPDKSIDLVLTDPPYGIGYDGNTTIHGKGGKSSTFKNKEQAHKKFNWDNETPQKIFFDEMIRVSKNQIIWGGNYFTDKLPVSRGWLYWDKKISNPNNITHSDGELAWTSYGKRLIKYSVDWIGFGRINSGESNLHPTQKPEKLFKKILLDYSKEGQTILDPFAGSGTTAIACHDLKRNFICIEKEPEYHRIATDRYNTHKAQLTLL